MSRSIIWFIAAALFLVAAIAFAVGSQWIYAVFAVAIAAVFFVLGTRANRSTGAR